MPIERSIEIDTIKYFKSDVEKMDKRQLKEFASFLSESELLLIKTWCNENFIYLIDNILFKL